MMRVLSAPIAWASSSDYGFELVAPPASIGDITTVKVRLVHLPDKKPVADAVIFETRFDMGPDGMPTMGDWANHLSTLFPDVRLKRFLEMRGADGGPWRRICALPAFWVGLLYDQGALDAAWDLVKGWSMEGREALRNAVPKMALDAPLPGGGKLYGGDAPAPSELPTSP